MSKAEEAAYKAYPYNGDYRGQGDSNSKFREAYINGYHQAEKDLELGWEDMMIIHRCIKDAMNYHLYKMMDGIEGQKEVYEEVLKRFKKMKED